MTESITPSAFKTGTYYSQAASATAKDEGIPRFKVGYITAPNTTDDGDTIAVDVFAQFGISKVLIVEGFIHTTEDSVVVEEDPTTAVTGTTLTITVGGSTDNKKRFYVVYGI